MRKVVIFLIAMFALFIPHSCNIDDRVRLEELGELAEKEDHSLERILKRGTLIASTDYNSTNYFIYRGEPAGYEFELLKIYAKELGVDLQIVVNNDLNDAFKDLKNGKVDLIAMGLTVTGERNQKVNFTSPMGQTRQVLVQRLPKGWRKMRTRDDVEGKLIRNPLALAGKMVYVPMNSSYITRLENLQEEIGDSINIVEFPRDTEKLIEMVAKGEIEYTVCDEHIAKVNKKYFPEIDVETPISFPQHMAWAVGKHSDSLRNHINNWLSEFRDTKVARFVYNKYFVNPRSMQYAHKYYSVRSGQISSWDEILKEKSLELEWDWRLIASLIYQESRFKTDATSWMGAFGLMQLMPGTAELYGVDSLSSPEQNIEAGVKHLRMLEERFKDIIEDPEERKKFVLASYNAGIAHVFDARRLAEKYNRDPNKWDDNVDYFLLNKSDPKYYNDSVVFYGYCRGEEPYHYVYDILDRYEHYKNVIED
ncbi:MAG: transglycosylase SLT domain-containing protein [Bacteroidales bacterium]